VAHACGTAKRSNLTELEATFIEGAGLLQLGECQATKSEIADRRFSPLVLMSQEQGPAIGPLPAGCEQASPTWSRYR